jgi:hypothetical protein
MGIDLRYPDAHAGFIQRCHQAGQTRPTPLLLRVRAEHFDFHGGEDGKRGAAKLPPVFCPRALLPDYKIHDAAPVNSK